MQNQNDFTFDTIKFAQLPQFVKKLHARGMHYIPLVDPGISAGEPLGTYSPYELGLSENIFIKDSLTGKPFIGKVWNPNSTVWPDFTHPNISHYWMTNFDEFHRQVEIDGAWIVSPFPNEIQPTNLLEKRILSPNLPTHTSE